MRLIEVESKKDVLETRVYFVLMAFNFYKNKHLSD